MFSSLNFDFLAPEKLQRGKIKNGSPKNKIDEVRKKKE